MENSGSEDHIYSHPPIKQSYKKIIKNEEHVVANHHNVVQELNWNQRVGRNVIGQKSELEQVFLKRKTKPNTDVSKNSKDYIQFNLEENSVLTKTNLPQEFLQKFISIKRCHLKNESSKSTDANDANINMIDKNCEFRKIYTKVTKGFDCNGTDVQPIPAK